MDEVLKYAKCFVKCENVIPWEIFWYYLQSDHSGWFLPSHLVTPRYLATCFLKSRHQQNNCFHTWAGNCGSFEDNLIKFLAPARPPGIHLYYIATTDHHAFYRLWLFRSILHNFCGGLTHQYSLNADLLTLLLCLLKRNVNSKPKWKNKNTRWWLEKWCLN